MTIRTPTTCVFDVYRTRFLSDICARNNVSSLVAFLLLLFLAVPLLTPSHIRSMENDHTSPQVAEDDDLYDDLDDDDLDDSWSSDVGSAPNDNLDEDTQYIQSPPAYQSQPSLCIVCHLRPPYAKGGKRYPTCGLTCAAKVSICCVCNTRPSYSNGPIKYPTCSLSCAAELNSREASQEASRGKSSQPLCVICETNPIYSKGLKSHPTCGLTCAAEFKKRCDYCHKRPKLKNFPQCGRTCRDKARKACLMCHSRPKNGRYQFCGRKCRDNARTQAPLILEVPRGHTTFDMVVRKFQSSWKTRQSPSVKKVYKVVENANFLVRYDKYLKKHGNERFCYHGTERGCRLGDDGHTTLCNSPSCSVCSILKTSFQVKFARSSGAFGAGVYTSTASNKSANYTTSGIMFLNKVVLGNVHHVSQFAVVNSCPRGFQSVMFDRMNGQLNETVVYTNDAIRPVFLIVFG
ncbi:hypothetical protein PILCRDRAFT_684926 [Piloderma croceum F 1598]|uniref:PARP catalytic domain-containing protein n=1 Tax=Piloderma croceum (strain F 1598) TaxID=765440 RepID=A0A0C3ERE3_PILCF|nr:hypothetical protein PILCRDRAFT_684926 [Piloderma croceum F 1598]